LCFLVFALVRPRFRVHAKTDSLNSYERAKLLLSQFGDSPVDYFKINEDNFFFFSDADEAFISYRIANGYAIVLEEPVCAEEDKLPVLREFDSHCKKNGLENRILPGR